MTSCSNLNATASAVRYGHAQDWQQVQDGKLIDLLLLRGSEAPQDLRATLRPRRTDFVLPLPSGRQPMLVAARYDNGLWARLPAVGSAKPVARNTTRVMLPEAATVTNNLKFAKALLVTADDSVVYKRTVGHLLELVPQRNPAKPEGRRDARGAGAVQGPAAGRCRDRAQQPRRRSGQGTAIPQRRQGHRPRDAVSQGCEHPRSPVRAAERRQPGRGVAARWAPTSSCWLPA